MIMNSFVPPFSEVTLCGVPSCVFGKSGRAAGEKMRNTAIDYEYNLLRIQLFSYQTRDFGAANFMCANICHFLVKFVTAVSSIGLRRQRRVSIEKMKVPNFEDHNSG
jgi:hypothetical protein